MTAFLDEAQAEQGFVDVVRGLGYGYVFGPELALEGERPERADHRQVVLHDRLQKALGRLNPAASIDSVEEAGRRLTRAGSPNLVESNRAFHQSLVDGVTVETRDSEGRVAYEQLRVLDFEAPSANDLLVVNQFTVSEGDHTRRPDVVVFVNGLPLVVVEIKNPGDEQADLRQAFNQLQTYKQQIPTLFTYNELLIVSDGISARAGTITADWDRFVPWRTVDGVNIAPTGMPQLDVLTKGMLEPGRLLDLLRFFVVFEDNGESVAKKVAAYHQYHAVNKAVACTLVASGRDEAVGGYAAESGQGGPKKAAEESSTYKIDGPEAQAAQRAPDGRAGVVWHTQGSGKSLTMTFFSGKVIHHPAMKNPTLLVLTDRNDLDGQLFQTFAHCEELLAQAPERAEDRADVRDKLQRASGGVIFSTIQKFFPGTEASGHPTLSDRSNVVVISDEAHRSQYGFIDGFARHMRDALPNATFIGFTGTPIEQEDKNTPAVFGHYIDIYDIQRANEDEVTVPIYYEGRLAKLELEESEKPRLDPEFEEVTEGEEEQQKQKLRTRWSSLEQLVGAEKRLELVARDLVEHLEARNAAMPGKAMLVCMSRRICVAMYDAITRLRPSWHALADGEGAVKVVMTGSASDPESWQPHVRSKGKRDELARRFKNPDDPLQLVIVRDMWLTGFDCHPLHTMYLDKPMRGHTLMQAIARVNRVFKDKPGGLVVDYLGLADELRKALANYTASGGQGQATVDQERAVAVLKEKYEVVRGMFHGFDYHAVMEAPREQHVEGLARAMDHILGLEDGKKRYLEAVTELSKAFALAVPQEEAIAIRDEVGFFQSVRAALAKRTNGEARSRSELDSAIEQIVSRAVASDEVIDIFQAAGLERPDISILSDDFLQEMRDLPQRNLAVEALERLITDRIKTQTRSNVVQSRKFSEMLEEAIQKYQNRAIEAGQVIEELIDLARRMRDAHGRGEQLGLSEDELAFYDALASNESAVEVLGDETLKDLARELIKKVRNNVSVDWNVREASRAKLRALVRRTLKKNKYPPDKQEDATKLVLEQAERVCREEAA